MKTFTRAEIKESEELSILLAIIVSIHKVAEHTIRGLIPNKHIEDFCEITKTFLKLPVNVYISYETSTWVLEEENKFTFPIRVEEITIYDNFLEYEMIRVKELSQAKPDERDAKNLNLN